MTYDLLKKGNPLSLLVLPLSLGFVTLSIPTGLIFVGGQIIRDIFKSRPGQLASNDEKWIGYYASNLGLCSEFPKKSITSRTI